MEKIDKVDKYERQNQIVLKLKNNPALSQARLSDIFEVSPATIHRDIKKLLNKGILYEEGDLIKVDPHYFLDNIQFSINEGFSLYTAVALLVDRSDFRQPNLVSSLRKLSENIKKSQPHLGSLFDGVATDNEYQDKEDLYTKNLNKIIEAWAKSRFIKIKYRSRSVGVKNVTVGILDFSPYADGHGNHLIGVNRESNKVEVFRFKRIEEVVIQGQRYNVTNRGELLSVFKDSWKIWLSDNPPKQVVLLFTSSVANRVLETKWHNNQVTEQQADGSLLWKCNILEPKEMEYWILGWGSSVEVISPPALRSRIAKEIQLLAKKYQKD
ncbi:MAG: hypothetical protein B6229_02160 [Spirochaetaceae bacterium 4572_7]|nr:MAG: hypothetical protein B6229_02160 [Spirochaetaceae bacterium 4572_7]